MFRRAFFLFVICNLLFGISLVRAVYDPLSVPNNRIGVHIFDTSEVISAAKLVNSSGGDWGYVTIPIRTDDRDLEKWRNFFVSCRTNHLIPILRLASYANGSSWVVPNAFDLVDFANFLNDLPWPVKNRYIIIYNEPNHGQEWGDAVAPEDYAALLVDARVIFSSRSADFFLISAGLDMSAPNSPSSLDALTYYRRMTLARPDWYQAVDGLAFHAYPNPAFTSSPFSLSRYGILSYRYELGLFSSLGFHTKPIFISETGSLAGGDFYTPALSRVWTDPDIVAITPFVLFAGAGDFARFSLLDTDNKPTPAYTSLFNFPKTPGSPLLTSPDTALGASSVVNFTSGAVSSITNSIRNGFNLLLNMVRFAFSAPPAILTVSGSVIRIEIADTPALQAHGLSDRDRLDPDSGMLFTFSKPQIQSFWMKDMHFPLDIIWIRDKHIVGISPDLPPPGETGGVPKVVFSNALADWVLEVNAGYAEKHHLKIGDIVYLGK